MKTFDDLVFKPHPIGRGCVLATLDLGNDIEVSVVGGEGMYGDGKKTFEVAGFYKTLGKFVPMPDGDDVSGWNSKEEVTKIQSMTSEEIRKKIIMDAEIKKLESLNKISFDLKHKIITSNLEDQYRSILYDKYKLLEEMKEKDSEYFKLKNWILIILNLPLKKSAELK
jgi:CO dehydrogenase/acetyl-CoA synthase beta subunit